MFSENKNRNKSMKNNDLHESSFPLSLKKGFIICWKTTRTAYVSLAPEDI